MRAVHAVRAVHTALTPVPGIVRAHVTLGEVVLEHDGRATCAILRDAIGAAGYIVTHCAEESRALPTIG
jgi:copper chaperone CopZ